MLQVTVESQLDELRERQRREFQQRVLKLFDCYQNNLPYDPKLMMTEEEEEKTEAPTAGNTSQRQLASTSSAHTHVVAPVQALPIPKEDEKTLQLISGLKDMGFNEEQSRCALKLSNGDMVLKFKPIFYNLSDCRIEPSFSC